MLDRDRLGIQRKGVFVIILDIDLRLLSIVLSLNASFIICGLRFSEAWKSIIFIRVSSPMFSLLGLMWSVCKLNRNGLFEKRFPLVISCTLNTQNRWILEFSSLADAKVGIARLFFFFLWDPLGLGTYLLWLDQTNTIGFTLIRRTNHVEPQIDLLQYFLIVTSDLPFPFESLGGPPAALGRTWLGRYLHLLFL